jgi:hypothetical protein
MLQPFHDEMRVTAKAHRGEVELVGVLPGVVDQFGQGLDGHILVEDHDLLTEKTVGGRFEILERFV